MQPIRMPLDHPYRLGRHLDREVAPYRAMDRLRALPQRDQHQSRTGLKYS